MRRFRWLLFALFLPVVSAGVAQPPQPRKVIDVHVHAGPADWTGSGAPTDAANEDHLRKVVAEMDRFGVALAVISGPMAFVEHWKARAPERFIASVMFPCDGGVAPLGGRQCFPAGEAFPDLEWLRNGYTSGALGAMGEITTQYAGLSPSDLSLEPYFRVAEELDVPVGVHTGLSYPGTPYQCCPKFRAELGRPLLMEDMLVRHPKLRVYAMHAGYPYADETVAAMSLYPQLHVDVSAINFLLPRPLFHAFLQTLIEHGMAKRVLFGSDDFPLKDSIESITSAPFLTDEQKGDILCRNAARFFRLDEAKVCH